MDANNTRYHLLLGEADWARCQASAGMEWDDAGGALRLQARIFRFPAALGDVRPKVADRRGAARDRHGNWYWISHDEREIRVRSAGDERVSTFWACGAWVAKDVRSAREGDFDAKEKPAPVTPARLRGLAATEDHYLVVGVPDPDAQGVLIFDLHAGGPPRHLPWPAGVPFSPFDMAARPGGGVWILDRAHKRYWGMDRGFNVIAEDQVAHVLRPDQRDAFRAREAPPGDPPRTLPGRTFPEGITGELAAPLADLSPMAIEALPDGSVLILDRTTDDDDDADVRFSLVHRYRFGERLGPPRSTEIACDALEAGEACRWVGHDFAFVPQPSEKEGIYGQLFVASDSGNQALAFNVEPEPGAADSFRLKDASAYYPMRQFRGRAIVAVTSPERQSLCSSDDDARDGATSRVYYDFGDDAQTRWLALVSQARPRFERTGSVLCPAFDGHEPDCVWHRVMLDAAIPQGAQVTVYSRAANSPDELEHQPWSREPSEGAPDSLCLRREGSELPFAPARPGARLSAGEGTWEVLLQHARGRFMQLRLDLAGDGRTTPSLRALRAYYPRFSYLAQYLPAVYREDAASAGFLDRFLANLEGIFTALEDKIAAVQLLFDVRSAPSGVLDWLAGWFDVALDPAWDDYRRRLFIRHAMDFFQWRGTAFGLRMALRLAFDQCIDESAFEQAPGPARARRRIDAIRIAEGFLAQHDDGEAARARAHHFTVQMPMGRSGAFNAEDEQRRLRLALRIANLEKPAHTTCSVQFYWAMFRVDHARLGDDTVLGLGGRAPELMPPMILGQGYLLESVLRPGHPQDIGDPGRFVVGRDVVSAA